MQFGTDFTLNASHWLLDSSMNSTDDWALALTLSGDYRFKSSVDVYAVSLEISGFCKKAPVDEIDCDMFLGFGSSNKYITFLTDFDGGVKSNVADINSRGISIYPPCNGSLGVGSVSDILEGSSDFAKEKGMIGRDTIRMAMAGGNVSNWHLLTEDTNEETWPITLNITNDVASNQVTFSFVSDTLNLECSYNDTFPVDEDVVVALQSDINGNDVTKDDIYIEYINIESS